MKKSQTPKQATRRQGGFIPDKKLSPPVLSRRARSRSDLWLEGELSADADHAAVGGGLCGVIKSDAK